MSHQVSEHKAGEGTVLQLGLTRTAAPPYGIYTKNRLSAVFPMHDTNVISCYFHCNLPISWSDQWHVYLQAFVTAKLLAVSMLST